MENGIKSVKVNAPPSAVEDVARPDCVKPSERRLRQITRRAARRAGGPPSPGWAICRGAQPFHESDGVSGETTVDCAQSQKGVAMTRGLSVTRGVACAVVVFLTVFPTLATSSSDRGRRADAPPRSPRLPVTRSPARPANIPTIAPGQTRIFGVADGGATACAGLLNNPISLPPPSSREVNCLLPRYGVFLNGNDPTTNSVNVFSLLTGSGAPPSIPAHAASAVYNEFTVQGAGGGLVDAQIAVRFDFVGNIVGVSLYRNELSLSLVVEDVTAGQPVGELSLFSQGRDGDQGLTDVSGAVEIVPVDDGSNGFIVKVRRGHTYRVSFQLEVQQFGFGLGRAEAQWSTMVVSLGEDNSCEPVAQQRRHQGCDGADDDCDGAIDECDEDRFGPTVFVDPSVRNRCFASQEEALATILEATAAGDDCGAFSVMADLDGFACDVLGSATATDDCGNATTFGGLQMRLDGMEPLVTCSTEITEIFPANHSFTDVGFSFIATDNCVGDLEVEVKVTSDEQTTLPPGTGNASPFPDAVVMRTVAGTLAGVLLRGERGGGGDGRVYHIHVLATDRCGNTGRAVCAVSVPINRHGTAVDNGQFFDATAIN